MKELEVREKATRDNKKNMVEQQLRWRNDEVAVAKLKARLWETENSGKVCILSSSFLLLH